MRLADLISPLSQITDVGMGQPPEELARSNCEVAVHMTRRLGPGTGIQRGLNEIYERWDGKGNPRNYPAKT